MPMEENNRDRYRGRKPPKGSLTSWIPILIFLFCFPPLGVVLLILRLVGVGQGGRGRQRARHPYDLQREAGAYQSPQAAQSARQEPAKTGKQRLKDAAGGKEPGKGMAVLGGIIAAVFGFGAVSEFLDALSRGGLSYELGSIFTLLAFCGVGLFLCYRGTVKRRQFRRMKQYLSLIGRHESIKVSTLAEATGIPARKIRDDLQDMLDMGIFPTGYLDLRTDRLVLSEEGVEETAAPQPEPPKEEEKAPDRDETILAEIRALNDAIEDPVMSAKIDRIGEITGKILNYLREHPKKEGQLRSFLNYYLPTTLKILRAYAQMEAQGIEGENITAATDRIEGMMDKVVDGFEKQLDKLFQDDAMDITTDVEVLERMLDKDGLGGEGMTLGG